MAVVEPVETPSGAPRRLRLKSPVDFETLGEIEVTSEEEVRSAVERARKLQPEWAALDANLFHTDTGDSDPGSRS